MMRIFILMIGFAFAMRPGAALAVTPDPSSLLCGGIGAVMIDAGQFVVLRKAELSADRFTAWIWYGVTADSLKRAATKHEPGPTLATDWALGYQLDDGAVAGLHPLNASTEMVIVLTFPHLNAGQHRLRLGLIDTTGELTQDNAYCFSSPGKFALKVLQSSEDSPLVTFCHGRVGKVRDWAARSGK